MHSTRRAYVTIPVNRLEDLGAMMDAGLEVISSAASDRLGAVKLLIAGDALPEECESASESCLAHIPSVMIEVTTEAYGRQRLVRVSKITLS